MDEIIVRVARAIASLPRLRLLACLARRGEVNPNALADTLRMPVNTVSGHLRVLLTAGLVLRRKSGAWCHYRAESPYGDATLSGKIATWLASTLGPSGRPKDHAGPPKVRHGRPEPEAHLHATIIEAATAFTDLRRVQMLRHLARKGTVTAQELRADLSMSAPAVSRHTEKLRRRGYVQVLTRAGQQAAYALSDGFKTPIHARMFRIVRCTWDAAS